MAHITRTKGPVIYCLGGRGEGRGGSLGRSHGLQGEQRADHCHQLKIKGGTVNKGDFIRILQSLKGIR